MEANENAVPVDGKMDEFVSWIENLTVLDLSKLVKVLEARLGVSAAAPMAAVSCSAVRLVFRPQLGH